MKSTILTVLALFVAVTSSYGEAPPQNMQEHLRWCAAAPSVSEAITRYEGFWREYLPAEDGGVPRADGDGRGYGDAPHVLHVRLCAYRLLKLYIETGNQNRAAYFAKWLETTDPMVGVQASTVPKAPDK